MATQLVGTTVLTPQELVDNKLFTYLYLYGTTEQPQDLNDRIRPYVSDASKLRNPRLDSDANPLAIEPEHTRRLEYHYEHDAATSGARIQVTVEGGTATQARIDNLILVNGRQLVGGAQFLIDHAYGAQAARPTQEWSRLAGGAAAQAVLADVPDAPMVATLEQMDGIVAALLRARLHLDLPAGGGLVGGVGAALGMLSSLRG